jgi:hypothetical protein
MIVFIAPFPALSDQKDGMIQRIASIDNLVSDIPRIYLDISFRRFLKKRTHRFGEATVFQLNAILHFFNILIFLKKASVVYIHSVYNSLKALPAYWIAKTITDLHGVVPEENLLYGYLFRARLLGWVERIALRRSAVVIFVTFSMQQHFLRKYGQLLSANRIISILPKISDMRGNSDSVLGVIRDAKAVIYAGGLQTWQNVPMMLDCAASTKQFQFTFLTSAVNTMKQLAESQKIVNCTIASVPPDQVADYYLKSTFGFVLRDPVLVNLVACPTKLVEYLYWGVIPIVLTPDIGDFKKLGFMWITIEEFTSARLPDATKAALMREHNRKVVERLIESCENELSKLHKMLKNID